MRISLNLCFFPFELSRCKLKSPNIYKLSWRGIRFPSKSWKSSKNWHVPFWSLYRQTTTPLNELFPNVLWRQKINVSFYLTGQKLECLHLLLSAHLHEVREKTNSQEVRYQLFFLFRFIMVKPYFCLCHNVKICRCYIFRERDIFLFIDRTFTVAILILSFEPDGPTFKLTFPASRSKIVN